MISALHVIKRSHSSPPQKGITNHRSLPRTRLGIFAVRKSLLVPSSPTEDLSPPLKYSCESPIIQEKLGGSEAAGGGKWLKITPPAFPHGILGRIQD